MSVEANNVELGEGILYIQEVSPNATVEVDVGATLGAELMYKKELKEVECGQKMSPILSIIVGEEGTFKVKMLESTMINLATAMGLEPRSPTIGSESGYTYINFGGETTNVYHQLRYSMRQQQDSTKFWRFMLWKCRAISGVTIPFQKDTERAYDVEFRMYPDSTRSDALGRIERDRN